MPDVAARRDFSDRLGVLAYRYRVYLLCAAIFGVMSAIAPTFGTADNLRTILKAASENLPAAIGFTLVLICGQLDLSVGSVMTLGGMMVIGLEPRLGWTGSFVVAVACGAGVGLLNGLLVAKARINSFIVTLGTMIIVQNLVFIYCHGDTIPARGYALADWLDATFLIVLTPRVVATFAVMALAAVLLGRTPTGRGFYLLGGNPQTAWFSGLRVNRYVIGAFVASALLSALGGALYSMSEAVANPRLGESSLMAIVAAVIIGGTSMAGGRGSVMGTTVAMIALTALIKGLNCLGAGFQVELMASGVVLALVILYDAWRIVQKNRTRGQRHELLAELEPLPFAHEDEKDDLVDLQEGSQPMLPMPTKDRTFALACVAIVACVCIAGIVCMFLRQPRGVVMTAQPGQQGVGPQAQQAAAPRKPVDKERNLRESLAVDVLNLRGTDRQLLVIVDDSPLNPPPRPEDPLKLPEDDALHWYDMEYAGWRSKKVNQPTSPGDGAKGKYVVCLRHMDHPYTTAYTRGMNRIASAYGIRLKTLTAGNCDAKIQSQQVDQVINEKPDMVILFPVEAKAVVPMLRKLNKAGVPVIASNLIPVDEGMQYVLTWTGPDDWGQFRMLAREFAKRMNYQGGYCVVRHMPGCSPYFSRTFAVVTELKKIAPKMKCLEKQTTDLEAEKSMQTVSAWISKYGDELKGIVSADDSGAQVGINEACKNAKREDIIRVAAGNSKVGMDFIKAGKLHGITYQSAEADGALPMKLAADWFNGKPIEKPVYYLPKMVITKENVDQYLPAQW